MEPRLGGSPGPVGPESTATGRELERKLAAVGRRVRASRALEDAARFGLLTSPLALASVLARPFMTFADREAAALALAPIVAGLVLGALRGLLRPVRRETLAALVDERAGLGALAATSLELEGAAHPFRDLVLAEAESAAPSVVPAEVAEIAVPRALAPLLVLLALGAVLFLLPPLALHAASAPGEGAKASLDGAALDAVARAGAELRVAGAALPPGAARRALEEAGRDLQRLAPDVESGKLDRREALARLGAVEEAVHDETAREEGRQAARRELSGQEDLKKLLEPGATGEGALRALSEKLERDDAARDKAREALERAARAAKDQPALEDSLVKAVRAVEAARGTDAPDPRPALADLARALANAPSPERDEEARKLLAKVSSDLERARSALASGDKPGEAPKPGDEAAKTELAKAGDRPQENARAKPGTSDSPNPTAPAPSTPRPSSAEPAPRPATETPPRPDSGKPAREETAREGEKPEGRLPVSPELAADLVKMFPPELLAEAMKLGAKLGAGNQGKASPPQVKPEDVEKFLGKLPEDTLRKLAKAVSEVAKDMRSPQPGAQGKAPEVSPELAARIAREIPPDVMKDVQRAVERHAAQAGASGSDERGEAGTGTGTGTGSGSGEMGAPQDRGISAKDGTSHRDPSRPKPRGPAGDAKDAEPTGSRGDKDGQPPVAAAVPPADGSSGGPEARRYGSPGEGEKGRSLVPWRDVPPGEVPPGYAEAAKAALERQRVPRAYERVVRDYFDLPKRN